MRSLDKIIPRAIQFAVVDMNMSLKIESIIQKDCCLALNIIMVFMEIMLKENSEYTLNFIIIVPTFQ